ncbi:hypothetical protein B0T22DRAFT_174153 [Podospora appendiculata]|uniref:SWR1-complex protein 3 domain-containing protein n=1 Tax=Podospora appendiculata TaxID=314037 RepID=A0AAE1CDG7_9PEZI|nr:hypothetical protein B0T22DRAFT_174153 [Podospora appendiculata]
MERKRKLPARAAARVEQIAKKRTLTPPQRRSETPASATAPPEPEPTPVLEPPPPLPKSITPGKPLPTVETPQPDDLSNKDYQSTQESGVLGESITRSRQRWITEGIFEKYWSKPTKKKGVLIEDPNNPPKESMAKLGLVTITVEPHVFEATMYAVKDPKPPSQTPQPTFRPIIQYGPPNGVMPPPPPPPAASPAPKQAPPAKAATPAPSPSPTPAPGATQTQTTAQTQVPNQPAAQAPTQPPPRPSPQPPSQSSAETATTIPQPVTKSEVQPPPPPQSHTQFTNTAPAPEPPKPVPIIPSTVPWGPVSSPRGMESVLAPNSFVSQPSRPPAATPAIASQLRPPPSHHPPTIGSMITPTAGPAAPLRPPAVPLTNAPSRPAANGVPAAGPAGKPAPGTDPIILTLAEKAGEDPGLRDLMKKVALGNAAKHELERFQSIIDAITAESKRRGTPVGPSADRLLVDGRTVRYFADEVGAILDIVLSSNPKQTSADLKPPAGSDPLVVLLVKAALDEVKTRDMVRRIADNKPQYSDATDLKVILDRLRTKLAKDKERQQAQSSPAPTPTTTTATTATAATATATATPKTNGAPSSQAAPSPSPAAGALPATQPLAQQALRSKGPPPPPKPDISAVVFEFSGGTGDRYLFPKFSMLENVAVGPGQQQVVASFLIVRRGSKSEYPVADPELDYYQPITIRLFTTSGKHLDSLARVVAPQEEVRRYMDDIMDKMTRAEYILLAMRLPRSDGKEEPGSTDEKEKESQANGPAAAVKQSEVEIVQPPPHPGVLWGNSKPPKPEIRELPPRSKVYKPMDVDDQYQSFVSSVSRKEVKEV